MELLNRLIQLYGEIAHFQFLRKSQNSVYSADVAGRQVIFRITPEKHRSAEEIDAEIQFLRYLLNFTTIVCCPIPTLQGGYFVEIKADECLTVCCFERALGHQPSTNNQDEVKLFARGLREIHVLSRKLAETLPRRSAVDSSFYKIEPASRRDEHSKILTWIDELPRHQESFGIIHGDYNTSNVLISGRQIRIFDFDDISYHWYDYDIANTLYMVLFDFRNSEDLTPFVRFKENFIKEMNCGQDLVQYDACRIDNFLHYRVILLEYWMNHPSNGPLFIRNMTKKWAEELASFITWFRSNSESDLLP